ncbi:MAG: hypothetical protein U0Y68_12905 [Blastocatellia bacterium]
MPRCKCLLFVCLFVLFTLPLAAQSDVAHPLDPLSPDEIATTVATLKAENKVTESSRFVVARTAESGSPELASGRSRAA